MRLSLLVALALASACNNTVIDHKKDLGAFLGEPDMADPLDFSMPVMPVDMAGLYGCYGFTRCLLGCVSTGSSASTCLGDCALKSRSDAMNTYEVALGCNQQWCLDKNGASATPYRCKFDSSAMKFLNLDGTMLSSTDPKDYSDPQKACQACLTDATSRLLMTSCVNPTADDCNPTSCLTQTNACLSDMP